jgi:N-acetylmuramic acid 6-phosphate (MurNAc-6-P) etherase
MSLPVTERQNCLTTNIDLSNPVGMVRYLRQSDAQIFSGYEDYQALTDQESMEALAKVAWKLSEILVDPKGKVFLSGAGTSGRLAHLHSLEFNRLLREHNLAEVFVPLIAGGEAALIKAQEFAEDSAEAALVDLDKGLEAEIGKGMFIGITCGLSSPYMAAQLDYMLKVENFQSVVLGFNPVSQAREIAVEGWDKTVKQVIDEASENDRFTVLNPVYGPEPITGSTRMQGGSMTKICLELIFATALDVVDGKYPALNNENYTVLIKRIVELVGRYRGIIAGVYNNVPALGELVRLGGMALRSGGRIHYLGRGIPGLFGIIDASECPPTFGADFFDVRGYIREGWEYLGYNPTAMRAHGKTFEIDHDFFEKNVLPEVSKGDLVVAIAVGAVGDNTNRLLTEARRQKARTAILLVTTDKASKKDLPEADHHCVLEVPTLGFAPGINNEAELGLKLGLNALTTGAHIMAGKIYQNVMIDLRISNTKLYFRAIGLICKLASVSEEVARRALHFAVYRKQCSDQEIADVVMSEFVQQAIARPKIIPLSILLATGKLTFDEAEERLASEPRIRRIIEGVVEGNV